MCPVGFMVHVTVSNDILSSTQVSNGAEVKGREEGGEMPFPKYGMAMQL